MPWKYMDAMTVYDLPRCYVISHMDVLNNDYRFIFLTTFLEVKLWDTSSIWKPDKVLWKLVTFVYNKSLYQKDCIMFDYFIDKKNRRKRVDERE